MSNYLSSKFTADQILKFMEMARAAYESEESIKSKYGSTYRIIVAESKKTEGQCILLFDDTKKVQYIVSRGSSNLTNWIKDAEYIKTLDSKTGIYIHKGFVDSAREIYDYILSKLNTDYTTYLTGHSLGGAITVILHLYLMKAGFSVQQSVTFGQPMITNYDGVTTYNSIPLLRVVNKKDLVPLLPPLTYISSESGVYRHFGEETILLKDGYYCNLDETSAEDISVSDFWANTVAGQTSIIDHIHDLYIANIKSKLSGTTKVEYSERTDYLS
ncbi:MAG: triacylglycerol lipase [Massilibacillus sp.]|jgi:predicted lipase|nr:triacylglycerol lipase [Massilibacillus sp.]